MRQLADVARTGDAVTPPVTASTRRPSIESIVASATRAEVETDVTLTATVRDAETPVAQLKYEWKADAGTFTGEGASVKWRAPKGATTPADYTVRLTVTETYGCAIGGSQQNIVNGTSPVIRLHDSPKELGDLSLGFLGDFANSSVSPSTCVRNFSDSCRGKADEKGDIESNREHFVIPGSSLRLQNVRVGVERHDGRHDRRVQLHVAHHQVRARGRAGASSAASAPSQATACSLACTSSSGGGCARATSHE